MRRFATTSAPHSCAPAASPTASPNSKPPCGSSPTTPTRATISRSCARSCGARSSAPAQRNNSRLLRIFCLPAPLYLPTAAGLFFLPPDQSPSNRQPATLCLAAPRRGKHRLSALARRPRQKPPMTTSLRNLIRAFTRAGRPAFAFLLSLGFAALSSAQTDARGTITGTVSNTATGANLEGAEVTLAPGNLSTFTSRDGRFVLSNVPAGVYTLRASF